MKKFATAALSLAIVLYLPLSANAGPGHGSSHNTAQAGTEGVASAPTEMSEGEVRKVDKDAGKITLRHGELKNLDMPPMTMVFRVTDPAMLEAVKPGDKVRFVADKTGGQFAVTHIEVKK